MLTSREVASLVVTSCVVVGGLILARSNLGPILQSFGHFLRSLARRVFVLILALYAAWVVLVVLVAERFGLWNSARLKDSVLIASFVGVPLLFGAVKATDGGMIARKALYAAIGAGAIAGVYINAVTLPFWSELVLQFAFVVLSLLGVVAALRHETKGVATCVEWVLTVLVLGLACYVLVAMIRSYTADDWAELGWVFALGVYLPLACLPIVYYVALLAAIESALMRVDIRRPDRAPIGVRAALVLGFHFRLLYAKAFALDWIRRVSEAEAFREARLVMKEYRASVRERRNAEERRLARLDALAGATGRDDDGWLDRREFYETKRALAEFWPCAATIYRLHGAYRADGIRDLLPLSVQRSQEDLPIQIDIRRDAQAWRAWRTTAGSYVFAVGGLPGSVWWEYDDDDPPATYPGEGDPRWINRLEDEASNEWRNNDDPIPPV